jgi:hypothetical protein
MANSPNPVVIAIIYVAILTALVFFKFNLIYPAAENEFVFSGDFVRPITKDSAYSYYLRPFVLSDYTSSMDLTAPVRIAYWAFVLSFTQIIPLNLVYWFLIVGTHVAGAALIALSCNKILKSANHGHDIIRYVLPLIPAVLFLFSYPVNYRPYWLFLPLLPALLCYVLTTNYATQKMNRKLYSSEKATLVGLGYISILQPHLYVIVLGAMLLVVTLDSFVKKIHRLSIRDTSATFLHSLLWFSIPFMLILIPIALLQNVYNVEIAPDYAYNLDVLRMMSQNSDWLSALTFSNGFWEKVVFSELEIAVMLFIVLATMVLFAITGIRRKEDRPLMISAVITFAIVVSFSLGFHNPIYRIIADPEFSQSWIFRDPFKMSLGALGIFLFALSVTIVKLSQSSIWIGRKLALIGRESIIIGLAVLVILWDPVQKTSETLAPSVVPHAYLTTATYLEENNLGPAIFIPDSGSKYTWTENANLQTQFLAMTNTDRSSGPAITQNPKAREFLTYSLQTGDYKGLGLAARSVVLDASFTSPKYDQLKDQLIVNNASSIDEHLFYLKNNNFQDVRIQQGNPIYLIGSVDYSVVGELAPFNVPVVFMDPYYSTITESHSSMSISFDPKGGDPAKGWVKGYSHDPLHGEWHHYLTKNGIQNWQSDNDKGFTFTSATKLIDVDAISDDDILTSWTFGSAEEIASWRVVTPEKQAGATHVLSQHDETLQVTLWNSTQGWKVIRSPLMNVDPSHTYKLTLDAKGENTLRVHTKLVEYDEQNKVAFSKNLNVLGDGTFDWKEATYQYSPSSENVTQVQLQVWHGHESDKPLPNKIWLDNLRLYDLTKHYSYPSVEDVIDIPATGDYVALIRYLKSPAGGSMVLHIDNQSLRLDSRNNLTTFVWERLQLAPLKAGDHKVILESVEGFNAVNIAAVVPLSDAWDGVMSTQLEGKTLLMIFPADNALYHKNATVTKSQVDVRGSIHYDFNGKSWREIAIVRDGAYMLALRGTGIFQGKIAEHPIDFTTDGEFAYSPILDLKKGSYMLEIQGSEDSLLQSVWVYSTEAGNSIKSLLTPKTSTSQIISYERANPVMWNISISSQQSSIVNVAQFYDPLWEARVYVGDQLIETAQPIPLYGLMTGFQINTTGENLRVILQYRVQEGFNMAMMVPLVGFIALTLLPLLNLVRRRHSLGMRRSESSVRNRETVVRESHA